jgi:hypothetical protein
MANDTDNDEKESWMNTKWRPMMGWLYMMVCFMDFIGFPILWSLVQAYDHGNVTSQWQPLTLQGAGLFHLAMGAVIGISAYGRTQEKLNGAAGPTMSFGPGVGTTYIPPTGNTSVTVSNQPLQQNNFGGTGNGGFSVPSGGNSTFGSPSTGGFGNSNSGFNSSPPSTGFSSNSFGNTPSQTSTGDFGQVTTGFGGKPAPVQPPQPAI